MVKIYKVDESDTEYLKKKKSSVYQGLLEFFRSNLFVRVVMVTDFAARTSCISEVTWEPIKEKIQPRSACTKKQVLNLDKYYTSSVMTKGNVMCI